MTPRISNAYYHLQGEGHQCHFLKEIGKYFFIKAKIFIYINIKKKIGARRKLVIPIRNGTKVTETGTQKESKIEKTGAPCN